MREGRRVVRLRPGSKVRRINEVQFEQVMLAYPGQVWSPGAMSSDPRVRRAIYDWAARGLIRAWALDRGEFYVHRGDCLAMIERYKREGRVGTRGRFRRDFRYPSRKALVGLKV